MKKHLLGLLLLSAALMANAQAPTYKVYAVKFAGSGYPFKVADWVAGGPKDQAVKFNFMVWLIKGSNGKNILLDAGFLNDIDDAREFKVTEYVRPDSALLKLGVKPGDISDVIISHPHWDHIDGLGLFPNAKIWIQKADYGFVVGDAWQKKGESGGFAKRDIQNLLALNLAGKLNLVDGDNKQIIPGITVFTGARHTFNSQYVLVNTGSKKIVLASDNVWMYYSLEHLKPNAPGGTLDPAGQIKAMQRMKALAGDARYVIPGHDAQVFTRFPKVMDGVVEIK